MWADIFMSAGTNIGSYFAARSKAKADRKWQQYNNAMVRLQDGQNQNTLTTNELLARRRHKQQAIQIQKSEFATKASVEVSAAAAGTTGKNVNMMLFDVTRTATEAQARNDTELDDTFLQINHQRQQSALGAQMNLDLRSIPSPSPLTYALGFAGDAYKALEKHRKS